MTLPAGPRCTLVDLWRWLYRPCAFLDQCARDYGDSFSLRPVGLPPTVVLSDPKAIAELFALPPLAAHAGAFNVVLRPFLGDRSLFVLDGREHLRARRLLVPPFHRERLEAVACEMVSLATRAVDEWPLDEAMPIDTPLRALSLEIVLRAIVGNSPRLGQLVRTSTELTERAAWPPLMFDALQLDLGRFSPWGRYRRTMVDFDALVVEEVRARRQQPSGDDILSLLLDTRDEDGEPMSGAELCDQVRTLMVAGHETTATALSWAVHMLLEHSAIYQRLQSEVLAAGAAGPLDAGRIDQLPLLEAVLQETLRLHPGIPMVGRILARTARIGGYELARGTAVVGSIYLAHRRAASYPDPQRFDPDRFIAGAPARGAFLPFGGGTRRCIAAAFAMREMKIVLATLLSRRRLQRAPGPDVRPVRRGVVITPAGGVPVVLSKVERSAVAPRASLGISP